MKKIILIIALILFPISVSAHQPRIVDEAVTRVKNPEISQAFYGELEGDEEYYLINSKVPFNLYANVLVPDIEGIGKDVFFEIEKKGEAIYSSMTSSVSWEYFYEHFAGDGYFMGPEFEREVEAGEYKIKVGSGDNMGKYVLAIGKIESFPLDETINTIKLLPTLKTQFFEKSVLTSYYNYIGIFMLVILVVLIGFVLGIYFLVRRYSKLFGSAQGKKKK